MLFSAVTGHQSDRSGLLFTHLYTKVWLVPCKVLLSDQLRAKCLAQGHSDGLNGWAKPPAFQSFNNPCNLLSHSCDTLHVFNKNEFINIIFTTTETG